MTYVQYVLPYLSADLGDPYGATEGRSNPHLGADVAPDGGGPCKAIAAGILVWDWFSPGLGHVAVLAHADGKFSGYAHLAAESPFTIGTAIERGAAFATIGDTGSLSRGRHLHITVASSMAGAAGGFDVIDPIAWINAHSSALAHENTTGALANAPVRIPTMKDTDDMKIKIIQPYNLPDRGVIGDVAYAFPNEGELAHFKNVWRGTIDNIDDVMVVGGPNMSEAVRRDVFNLLIQIHKSN
ncbi:M23 family metallopeptidase [Cryobacterium sp. Y62]|uniref:M23 family metallopeptidase n=1 Tax=Cryobacterium sp. Y62 TaxID=2048284 RepID=UPI001304A2B8|nr:M23 family metallopeptidase [Cryobacterium sp. Y62]